MSPKKPKSRVGPNGYRLCDPLPKGEVLIDTHKKEWVLGSPIGSGGFGDIYSCRRRGDRKDDYVIKLDNINGPLFQEMNFYMRAAKDEQIRDFMARHKLKFLGMPRFIANGIHDKSSAVTNKRNKDSNQTAMKKNAPTVQYRFLVMERFGDLLEDWVSDKKLTSANACDIAAKMIDVLEYIHSFGYIHGDIKGTNILSSFPKAKNQWYLIDFGLAERYCDQSGRHRNDKPDKKRANNGTVEYRSRDAHIGLLSRRSDVECLAYNLIQWLYGSLPWMSCLKDAKKVENSKENFFENLDQSLRKCFRSSVPKGLKDFLKLVDDIEYDSEPDYKRLKDVLLKKVSTNKRSVAKEEEEEEEESDEEEEEESDEEEEVIRKVSQSSSESTVDTLRMNSPRKLAILANKNGKQNPIPEKRTNKRKERHSYIELSDSEDSSVQTLQSSPPKRVRSQRNTPKSAANGKVASDLMSPNRRSTRKPLPRFSTPLLFATSDEEDSPEEEDSVEEVFKPTVLRMSPSPQKSKVKAKVDPYPNETPAMREMRERIEQKRLEKEMKKKKK